MKQSPEAAVSMLDSEHENPELIWNDDTRKKVSSNYNKMIYWFKTAGSKKYR